MDERLTDEEYDRLLSRLLLLTAVREGYRDWGGRGHVYASVSCVTFDPEKNKMMNEQKLLGFCVSSLLS